MYIPVYRQPGSNTLAIVDSIRNKLARINARLRQEDPKAKDLVLGVVMDQSSTVRASIKWLQISATLGAALAGLVVLVFLRSFRLTFIVVLAIPMSILVAMIGLFYTGDTMNSMTLGGLALAIGVLVDQSIVVIDNIVRHSRMNKSSMQAARDGTIEVALPVLVSTVTFVVVFFPVVFLTGIPRFLFGPLATTVILAVVASYLIAMLVIPTLAARLIKSGNSENGADDSKPPLWFTNTFDSVIRLRGLVIVLSLVVLAVAGWVATNLGTELFPAVDSKQFAIYVRLPSGTRIERTEDAIIKIEERIIETMGEPDPDPDNEAYPDSDLRILISNIGVLMDWPAAYTPNNGPMDAFVLVQTKGHASTFETVDRLRELLVKEFPTADFAFDTGGMMTGKALGISEAEMNQFTKKIGGWYHEGKLDAEAFGTENDEGGTMNDEQRKRPKRDPLERSLPLEVEPWRTVVRYANRITGFPRHLSIHCGGVVITGDPLTNYTPLQRAAKGHVITQMEMHAAEAIGLVKIDILSNRSLGVFKDCLRVMGAAK